MSGRGSMLPIPRLVESVRHLCNELKIDSAAITGGEPMMHPDLYALMSTLSCETGIHAYTMTTNGTIPRDYDFWAQLKRAGLARVNISIPDLLEYSACKDSMGRWPVLSDNKVASVYKSQTTIMCLLKKFDIPVDVNVVVFNDYANTWNVMQKLLFLRKRGMDFRIMLLPDILDKTSYERSIATIDKIIQASGYKMQRANRTPFSSNGLVVYRNDDGEIYVKSTMLDLGTGTRTHEPFYLESMCNGCRLRRRQECLEGFYGIRLEMVEDDVFVRLCLHRGDDRDVCMPIMDFFESPSFSLLKAQVNSE